MLPRSNFNSIPKQAKSLDERHADTTSLSINICGMDIVADPGVYKTSGDSELMAESVEITKDQDFLEIGCGTGVVSIAIAKRAANGHGVDINERAVSNSKKNAEAQDISNIQFSISNVFSNVSGTFDIIICNPPYSRHEPRDTIDRMFWDPEDEMKIAFFKEAGRFLKPNGKIYFGWANFADIDVDLPFKLAEENGFKLVNTFEKPHKTDFSFYVFEFIRKS